LAGTQGDSWCGDMEMVAGTAVQLWSLSRNNDNNNENNFWSSFHEPGSMQAMSHFHPYNIAFKCPFYT
jgi:hypothetical protein